MFQSPMPQINCEKTSILGIKTRISVSEVVLNYEAPKPWNLYSPKAKIFEPSTSKRPSNSIVH